MAIVLLDKEELIGHEEGTREFLCAVALSTSVASSAEESSDRERRCRGEGLMELRRTGLNKARTGAFMVNRE
jgi:hypothetical protein